MSRALIQLPPRLAAGVPFEVRVLVQHAMETGYRSSDGGERLPRDLIRRFDCQLDGVTVFAADLFAAVSANPFLSFWLQLERDGTLSFEWLGDRGFLHRESRELKLS